MEKCFKKRNSDEANLALALPMVKHTKTALEEKKRQRDADPTLVPAAKRQRAADTVQLGWMDDKETLPRVARCEDGVHTLHGTRADEAI